MATPSDNADMHVWTLENGLRILVKEDHRAPVVLSQIWYKVGSGHESVGITGISHALEHMMFKGTKQYGAGEFSRMIAKHGGQENAFTSYDYTVYHQLLATEYLPLSFQLEADRMQGLTLDYLEFQREMQVVMEERRMRTEDDPHGKAYERWMAAAHVSTGYHHPIIGWMHDLENMTVDDLRAWYRKWYCPNNALLLVVGDVHPDPVYQLAKTHFGQIKSATCPVAKPQIEIPPLGKQEVEIKLPIQVPWFGLAYPVPCLTQNEASHDPYVLSVIARILGGNSGRLTQDLVRGSSVAADISVWYDPYMRLSSLFCLGATPVPASSIALIKKSLLAEIKRLQTTQVTDEELSRVKACTLASCTYDRDSLDKQAYEIGRLEAIGLSYELKELHSTRILAVTAKQIQQAARAYFKTTRMTTLKLMPDKRYRHNVRHASPTR